MATTKEFLVRLADSTGVTGFEHQESADIVMDAFKEYCDEVYKDALGNVIGHKKGSGKHKILFAAHMDEIGLMVSGYEEGGFLRFTTVGGVDQRALVSQEVFVHGKEKVYGIIGVKPPHITKPEEAKKAHKIEDMAIDTGFSDEKLKSLVRIGDVVTIKRKVVELCGGVIAGKALDDRCGIASMYECMKALKNTKCDIDVYYAATVQEEIGCKGAGPLCYALEPDIAIAIDVGHAKTPDVRENQAVAWDKGPVISCGINIHPKVFKTLVKTAKDNFLDHQVIAEPGRSGTDAVTMQVSRYGTCSGVLSIPLKYMHTSVETIRMKDVMLTGKLLSSYVLDLCGEDLEGILCL